MNIKLLFACLCLSTFVFVSCGDDGSDCASVDFVGTWTGTEDCLGSTADVSVIITAGTSEDKLLLNGGPFDNETVNLEDCVIDGGVSALGIGYTIDGSLSGSTLSITQVTSALFLDVTCNYTLTK